jgi:hypothetical protein
MNPLQVTVFSCSRCHSTQHLNVIFNKFAYPVSIEGNVYKYWGLCPVTNEPLLMKEKFVKEQVPVIENVLDATNEAKLYSLYSLGQVTTNKQKKKIKKLERKVRKYAEWFEENDPYLRNVEHRFNEINDAATILKKEIKNLKLDEKLIGVVVEFSDEYSHVEYQPLTNRKAVVKLNKQLGELILQNPIISEQLSRILYNSKQEKENDN